MKFYSNYPVYIPFLRNICNTALVITGIVTLANINIWFIILYIAYCLLAAFFIMPLLRCTKCFYYQKLCSTGFSLVAQRLYKKKINSSFKEGMWHNIFLLPIALIPLSGAIYLLAAQPSYKNTILFSLVILSIASILTEHACFGCYNCKELKKCLAGKIVKRNKN